MFQYFVTGINPAELEFINSCINTKSLKRFEERFNIPVKDVITIGYDTSGDTVIKEVREVLESFKCNTKGEYQTHYRDYTKTLKEQKKSAWLINVCETPEVSWKTVLLRLKQPYCIVWKKQILC